MIKFYALLKKELRTYFNSPIAYIFITVFLTFSFWLFFRTFFLMKQADIRGFFMFMPWILLFLIPAITMRSWSEEYRQGTVETLLTSSISVKQAVLAKFLSVVIFYVIVLLTTISLPISISLIGDLDIGAVAVSYLGSFLLGVSYISLGVFLSSITKNQIVTFIISVIACFAFYIIGEQIVTFSLPGFIAQIFEFIGLGSHYNSVLRGVIDTRDIIYFLSFILFFIYLNIKVLKRKQN